MSATAQVWSLPQQRVGGPAANLRSRQQPDQAIGRTAHRAPTCSRRPNRRHRPLRTTPCPRHTSGARPGSLQRPARRARTTTLARRTAMWRRGQATTRWPPLRRLQVLTLQQDCPISQLTNHQQPAATRRLTGTSRIPERLRESGTSPRRRRDSRRAAAVNRWELREDTAWLVVTIAGRAVQSSLLSSRHLC